MDIPYKRDLPYGKNSDIPHGYYWGIVMYPGPLMSVIMVDEGKPALHGNDCQWEEVAFITGPELEPPSEEVHEAWRKDPQVILERLVTVDNSSQKWQGGYYWVEADYYEGPIIAWYHPESGWFACVMESAFLDIRRPGDNHSIVGKILNGPLPWPKLPRGMVPINEPDVPTKKQIKAYLASRGKTAQQPGRA